MGPTMDRDAETHLEDLVARALELRDAGESDWLAQACAGSPELERRVRDAVDDASKLHGVFSEVAGRDPHRGQVLAGRFRVLARLGSGAMGVVYRALDLTLRREVAVKVLRGGLVPTQELAARFTREAEAMASVRHASVIAVYDRGASESGEPFIVMELVDGESLADIVDELGEAPQPDAPTWLHRTLGVAGRNDPRYVPTVVGWVAELAAGLDAVHAAGVLHRDIKPSNILIRRDGRPVLLDFGIALLDQDSTLTRGATSVGTPAYMPPEALQRGGKRTPASDVYSLTATLYHLLALRAPYSGNPTEVLAALATREPKPVGAFCGGLPRDLQAIVEKGMAREPEGRYASAAELGADLRAYLEHRPVTARPVTSFQRALRRVRRSRAVWGAALALLAVAGAYGVHTVAAVRAAARAELHLDWIAALPPNLTIVGPSNRFCPDPGQRAAIQAQLDGLVDLGQEPVPMLQLRASWRLDHGDAPGAAADMRRLALHTGSAFVDALAARYAALPADTLGDSTLALAGLPQAATPIERYVYAYHLLRRDTPADDQAAFELLSAPDVRAAVAHAEELRLAVVPLAGTSSDEQLARGLAAYTDAKQLEARYGRPTAATANFVGYFLDVMNRYSEARRELRKGIALCGHSHVLRINGGFAAFALGLHDEALQHFEAAIALRPHYLKPLRGLVWTLTAAGRYDEALQRIDSAPLEDTQANQRWRIIQKGQVETQHALALRAAGDVTGCEGALARAAESYAAAQRAGDSGHKKSPTYRVFQGLRQRGPGADEAVFQGLVALVAEDPHHSWWLRSLVEHLPESLGPDSTRALRSLLQATLQRALYSSSED